MGKYLKQGFVRALEWQQVKGEISHSKMVELIEEECIKNYKAEFEETFNTKEEFKRTYQKRTKKLGMFLCPYFETFKTKEK